MDFESRSLYFNRNYEVISSYNVTKGRKVYLDDKIDGCRFCGKKEPDVSFRNISHAVPEFLGNKTLVLRSECDSCNKFFSKALEDHLDKFTKSYRVSFKTKGKKKTPSYKSKDSLSRFNSNVNFDYTSSCNENIEITDIVISPENQLFKIDKEKKEITYTFDVEKHIPVAVYKCLVKIGLSVLTKDYFLDFKSAVKWIKNTDHKVTLLTGLILLKTFRTDLYYRDGMQLQVFRKKDLVTKWPKYILSLSFSNLNYQIVLPSDLDTKISYADIIFIPLHLEDQSNTKKNFSREIINLSSSSIVNDKVDTIVFGYDRLKDAPEFIGKSFQEIGVKYP